GVGSAGQLAHHQLAGLGVAAALGRDQHVALDPAVVGLHVADAVLEDVTADQAAQPAFEHLDDRAFASATTVDTGDAGQHSVAVHDLAHFVRRQEQVVATDTVGPQEA